MEKLKKRLDDLELINNNVKLLNEMLSHYKTDASDHEKQIIEVHPSCSSLSLSLFLSLSLSPFSSLCYTSHTLPVRILSLQWVQLQ